MKEEFNNKGMTLVELLITFSLLMVVVVGMFNLILDIKLDLDDKQIIKNYIDYSSYYANTINLNLVKHKPFMIFIKEGPEFGTCYTSKGENCPNNIDHFSYYCNAAGNECISASNEDHPNNSSSPTFTRMCGRIYPCVVAVYEEKGAKKPIQYMAVAINVPSTGDVGVSSSSPDLEPGQTTVPTTTIRPLDKSKYGIGINYFYYKGGTQCTHTEIDKCYKGFYEQAPNQEYIYSSNLVSSIGFGSGGDEEESDDLSVSSNSLVIDFPMYKTGTKTNYGFKIVYPFVRQQQ